MNKMLTQHQIAVTTFKCLRSVLVLNLIREWYQWFTDPAADVHSTALD